jgi:heat-inducible transcriptional repressor
MSANFVTRDLPLSGGIVKMSQTSDILDDRSREMLTLLIRAHIATGEPVGSRTISRLTREGLSAATVRNIISDLEDAGYLHQPHTSAGRVPTDKGYRFFVDEVIEQTKLSQTMASAIRQAMLGAELPSADQLMSRASQLLSSLCESVGIVISPNPANEIIKHIEFVRLSDGRILVIVATRTGLVQDRLVRVNESFTQGELDRTARYVNANYSGLTLPGIREELLKRLNEEKALYDRLLQNAILLCEKGLSDTTDASPEVFVEGASNIINKADFADTERMRELFRLFEEKSRLVKILNECVSPGASSSVRVRIGAENNLAGLRGCAVITSYYSYGDEVIGSLGVVGPIRMEYARAIGVVNYTARALERALNERSM